MTKQTKTPEEQQEDLLVQESIIKDAALEFLDQTEFDFNEAMLPDVEMAIFTSNQFIDSSKHADYVFWFQSIKKLVSKLEKARILGGRLSDNHISIQV